MLINHYRIILVNKVESREHDMHHFKCIEDGGWYWTVPRRLLIAVLPARGLVGGSVRGKCIYMTDISKPFGIISTKS